MRMETMIENEQRQTSSHLESHADMPLTPLTGKPLMPENLSPNTTKSTDTAREIISDIERSERTMTLMYFCAIVGTVSIAKQNLKHMN